MVYAFLMQAALIAAVVVGLLYVADVGKQTRKRHRLPPGPRPWPVVGNLLSLGSNLLHLELAKLAKRYGPLMYLRLGSISSVVVSSPEIAKQVLQVNDQNFTSRARSSQTVIMGFNQQAIGAAPYGSYWRHARKVLTLELITGKRLAEFEGVRKEEVTSTLLSILDDCQNGKAARMDIKFGECAKNSITRMVISKAFFGPNKWGSNMRDNVSYMETIKEVFRLLGVFVIGDFIPFLRIFDIGGHQKAMRKVANINSQLFGLLIDEHRKELQTKLTTNGPKDVVDVLITRPSHVDETPLTDTQIKALVMEMITAGTETAASVLEWALTEILRHPDVLKRIQEELDTVVGKERLVQESDLPKLRYLDAVVKETLRLHPPGGLTPPRLANEACDIGGYHIPANCYVFVNIWAIHRDPAVWERPDEFDPERFMTDNIDHTGQNFRYLPFGSGRRRCPGIKLGILTSSIVLAFLLQTCDWALPDGQDDVDITEKFGFAVLKAIPLEAVPTLRLPLAVINACRTN